MSNNQSQNIFSVNILSALAHHKSKKVGYTYIGGRERRKKRDSSKNLHMGLGEIHQKGRYISHPTWWLVSDAMIVCASQHNIKEPNQKDVFKKKSAPIALLYSIRYEKS